MTKSSKAVRDFRWAVAEYLKQNCALVCYTKADEEGSPPRLAGFNLTMVYFRDDPPPPESEVSKLNNLAGLMSHFTTSRCPYEYFGVDKYLSAMGLYVLPDFHGDGLGEKILSAR